jgi:hypothetical protein
MTNFHFPITSFQFLLLLLILLSSCARPVKNEAYISGALSNGAREKLVLTELDTKSIRKVDSVVLDEGGKFNFRISLTEPGFYMVQSQQGKVLVLFARPGDTISLSGSMVSFPDQIVVRGPEETLLLEDFFAYTRKNEKKVDSLENLLVEKQESEDYYPLTLKVDSAFRQIWEGQRAYEKEFIGRHISSLTSLIVLNYAFGMNTVLSPVEDFLYYQRLDSALMAACPGNKHAAYHHQRMIELRREQEMKKGKKE